MVRFGGGQPSQRRSQLVVREEPDNQSSEPWMRDLAGEEIEETVQLVSVTTERRREVCGIGLWRRFEGADVELQPIAELLDPSEHANRVPLREARVEQLDVVPHARVD